MYMFLNDPYCFMRYHIVLMASILSTPRTKYKKSQHVVAVDDSLVLFGIFIQVGELKERARQFA